MDTLHNASQPAPQGPTASLRESLDAEVQRLVEVADRPFDDHITGSPEPISDAVFDAFPDPIRGVMDVLRNDGRRPDELAVVGLSMLAVSSAMLPGVRGRYGDRDISPAIYVAIIAPAGAGKDAARIGDALADVADARTRQRLKDEWEARKAAAPPDAASEPFVPAGLRIPADTSGAALAEQFAAFDGPRLMVTAEADTLSVAAGQDFGRQITVLLRKAYDHAPLHTARKGTAVEVDRLELAFLISGTPSQVLPLVRSSENGLFSRIIWLPFEAAPTWDSPRPRPATFELDGAKRRAGVMLADLRDALAAREHPLTFELTEDQWDRYVDAPLSQLKIRAGESGETAPISIVHRAGISIFRVAMQMAVLNNAAALMGSNPPDRLVASDLEVAAAACLVIPLALRAFGIFADLPGQPSRTSNKKVPADLLLDALPDTELSRSDVMKIGRAAGLEGSNRTYDAVLKQLVESGGLTQPKHGTYEKPWEYDHFSR